MLSILFSPNSCFDSIKSSGVILLNKNPLTGMTIHWIPMKLATFNITAVSFDKRIVIRNSELNLDIRFEKGEGTSISS